VLTGEIKLLQTSAVPMISTRHPVAIACTHCKVYFPKLEVFYWEVGPSWY